MSEFGTNKPGDGDQPTEKMGSAGSPGGGWGSRIAAILAAMRENPLYAGTAAGVILIALVVLIVASLVGGGEDEEIAKQYPVIRNVGVSWQAGQSSLASYDQFDAVAKRSSVLGEDRQTSYWDDQLDRDHEAVLARKRAQAEARRRYLEARRRAEEAYKKALAKAAAERRRKLREQKRKQAERLRKLREKYKITPGEECSLPEIRAEFDCSTGYPF